MATRKLRVFLSYSHKDEKQLGRLNTYLADLKAEDRIETWHDRAIPAGSHWKPAILRELDEADVILLLISPDFIASEFCRMVETARALERDRDGSALVIPVLLKRVVRFPKEIEHIQAVPQDLKAITQHKPQGDGYIAAVQAITDAIEAFAVTNAGPRPSGLEDHATDFEQRHHEAVESAVREFQGIFDEIESRDVRDRVAAILNLPEGAAPDQRAAGFRRILEVEDSDDGFFCDAMPDLSGVAEHPETSSADTRAIERIQMLLTRRIFPKPVLKELADQFRKDGTGVVAAIATHVGAEFAVKGALGIKPEFVSTNVDGTNGVAGHGLLHFVPAPLGNPSPQEDIAQILKDLANQIDVELDLEPGSTVAKSKDLEYWAGRINGKVRRDARKWWRKNRPLADDTELSTPVYYCVVRRPTESKRERFHELLRKVRQKAPALLFFELNPRAPTRDEEDTAIEFIARLLQDGKDQTL